LLELTDVTKRYESPQGYEGPLVLKGVSLPVDTGASLAIVGPSGSGKSTLLNIIGALDYPTSGSVVLDGEELSLLSARALAVIRSRKIGFVFQLHHLLPQCTVLENALLPALAAGDADGDTEARARDLLRRVGLTERMDYRPGRLSGGELQRAAVVRALVNEPKLLLGDEPTGSLDRAAAQNLMDLLVELNREQGVTLIVVTHSHELAARMGRVLELRDGKLREREPNQ
jgi:ABC-type lipoprotein export system ATPase subunit